MVVWGFLGKLHSLLVNQAFSLSQLHFTNRFLHAKCQQKLGMNNQKEIKHHLK